MTKQELIEELKSVNHSKEKRDYYSRLFMGSPAYTPLLLEMAFEVDDPISFRATWVLEFMCTADLTYLIPHLETFAKNLHRLTYDSAKRPMAKICEMIATDYYGHSPKISESNLTNSQKERIIETCFDWMIQDEKVAVKAYSMNALYLFGREFSWIHPELKIILEKDFMNQSAAFKARARRLLKKL